LSKNFNLKYKGRNFLTLSIPTSVFFPTGTTQIIFDAVSDYFKSPKHILDLGCGSGVLGFGLYKLGLIKKTISLSDLSLDAIKYVKKESVKKKIDCDIRRGHLFKPWINEKFEVIVNDVSGISSLIAKRSLWFKNVPCDSGLDGTTLVRKVIEQAKNYLVRNGILILPIISLSNVKRIIDTLKKNFKIVKLLKKTDWPMPIDLINQKTLLENCKKKKYIDITDRFGTKVFSTYIYLARI